MAPISDLSFKEFRLGARLVRARAQQIDFNRTVFLLELPATPILDWLLSWLPKPVRRALERLFPEWFLPPKIILKEENPDKTEGYKNEVRIYKRLEQLQGRYIPRFLGEATSDSGTPAIILQYVEGTPLDQLSPEDLRNEAVLEGLEHTYDQLTEHGVVHNDPELHNFIRTDGGVLVIDFDFAKIVKQPLQDNSQDFQDNSQDFKELKQQMLEKSEGSDSDTPQQRVGPFPKSMAEWAREPSLHLA